MTENEGTLVPDLGLSKQAVIQSLDVNSQEPKFKEYENSQESEILDLNCLNQETLYSLGASTSSKETPIQNFPVEGQFDLGDEVSHKKMKETIETRDGMDIDNGSLDLDGKSKSISWSCFLKRVLREEFGYYLSDNKLLFIAIHAIFLRFGFIGFDSVSKLRVDVFHFLEEQSSMSFTTSVCYTLPKLLLDDNVTESVVLKFQPLGHFVNVYGSLANSSWLHKLCLNKYKFVPAISFLWANCEKSDTMNENDESLSMFYSENEIFDLWRVVKDELAYPLFIDLCEKTGLDLPPCFMRMPPELKLKVLESLPGVDIARMACVCKEMQYLSSTNDLWKQKYAEEFGRNKKLTPAVINWKRGFVSYWKHKKKKEKMRRFFHPKSRNHIGEGLVPSNPFRFPLPMVGSVYNRLPGFGVPSALALPDQTP